MVPSVGTYNRPPVYISWGEKKTGFMLDTYN